MTLDEVSACTCGVAEVSILAASIARYEEGKVPRASCVNEVGASMSRRTSDSEAVRSKAGETVVEFETKRLLLHLGGPDTHEKGRRLVLLPGTMQAFRCLGQIFSAQGDDDTALRLFNVALDGFTFMDVHRWRADCMVRIAGILNGRGEVMKAFGLWKAARPLFERSSQMKDMIKLDAKLAEVDSAVLVEYDEKIQHLSDLCVPGSTPEEKYFVEDEEVDEDELAQTSDFGDKGRQEVLV
ncbi:hypothetical protein C8J57DRAFT_1230218 [Mycena rebaudengoi]|nr:hypothetical protein C8J57DRAFT_1230218 [Mycena rebaudengoi]